MTPKTISGKECELILDHILQWGGDGYYCSKCDLRFIPISRLKSLKKKIKNLDKIFTTGIGGMNESGKAFHKGKEEGFNQALDKVISLIEEKLSGL